MLRDRLLEIDAAINLGLGVALAAQPRGLMRALGMPAIDSPFYARVLGGVLSGIGLALLAERLRPSPRLRGLGLAGAVPINLSGAAALTHLLITRSATAPLRGALLLWLLDATLVGLSTIEIASLVSERRDDEAVK